MLLNIALFASAFYPSLGGVEELVRQLAHDYRRRGVGVIVLTNRWPRSLPHFEEYEGIPLYRLAMRVPEGSLKAHVNYHLTHTGIGHEMLDTLRRWRTDLLHIQCIGTNSHYALLAKRALNLPLVVTTQGERTMDAEQMIQRSAFRRGLMRETLDAADYITACSQNTLTDIAQWYGKPFPSPSEVIYNGIHLADFESVPPFAHPRPYILGIGRMVAQKGFDLLLQAYARANVTSHDLLLAGDGMERSVLEALVCHLNLSTRVRFVGRVDRPTAVALFSGCDFFVLPSRLEPLGIVNLEAMAAGKAVVAARVGGVPEIVVGDETGLLFPTEDVDAMAAALTRVAQDADLRATLGAAGRRRAQDFDWASIADQYLSIYRALSAASK